MNALLDSQWATGKDCIFTDRTSVVDYCHVLLCKEMYHRATLAKRKPKPAKASVTDGNETPGESGTEVRNRILIIPGCGALPSGSNTTMSYL